MCKHLKKLKKSDKEISFLVFIYIYKHPSAESGIWNFLELLYWTESEFWPALCLDVWWWWLIWEILHCLLSGNLYQVFIRSSISSTYPCGVMRRHDLTKKYLHTYYNTHLPIWTSNLPPSENTLETWWPDQGAFSKSVFSESVFSESIFSKSVFSKGVFSKNVFSKSVFSESVFSKRLFSKSGFFESAFSETAFSKNCIFWKTK